MSKSVIFGGLGIHPDKDTAAEHVKADELDNGTTKRIRELNDAFRRTGEGGQVMFTRGVCELAAIDQALALVRKFDAFTPDNDPHGEHDFGAFDHAGKRIFWQIECYDEALEYGSEDPADPTKTTRVLTIMLAEEY